MRVHYLQHVPFEGLGSIEAWLKVHGCKITCTRFFESYQLPKPTELDLLIVIGGPMSVNDEDAFPWLVEEKAFIRECIQKRKRVLGICLGAQLIASAMGARVYPNPVKEIGWWPVYGLTSTNDTIFRFPPVFEVFQWHEETFDLPPGAVHLARSEGCENQAFQLGRSVIGLQFHLEMTPDLTQEIISNGREELVPSRYIQSEGDILGASSEKYQKINALMVDVLNFLTRH